MRLYAIAVYLFLYIPIGIIVLFSFNAGRHASDFRGFSVKWYGKLTSNPFAMEALTTSLTVAFVTAVLASLFGTMAALALQRVQGRMRALYDAVIYIAIMIPGIVIGIATLIALVTVFNALNPLLASLWPEGLGTAPRLRMGYGSLIASPYALHHGACDRHRPCPHRRHGPGADRGLRRSLCDTVGDLPSGHAAADLSGHPWPAFS